MFSEVFKISSGGVEIISVVLSVFRGLERFPGGGDIFRVIESFLSAWEDCRFLIRGGVKIFQKLRFSHGVRASGYFKGVENFSEGVKDFLGRLRIFQVGS